MLVFWSLIKQSLEEDCSFGGFLCHTVHLDWTSNIKTASPNRLLGKSYSILSWRIRQLSLHQCWVFAAVFVLADCPFCPQEGPFVYMSLVGTVETSEGPLAELCEFCDCLELLCISVLYCYSQIAANSIFSVSKLHPSTNQRAASDLNPDINIEGPSSPSVLLYSTKSTSGNWRVLFYF